MKAYSLLGNNSNFNDEDGINFNFEEKNSNYYDFISRTSILILFSASHAVKEYSLANRPVLVVCEPKKINFKKTIKEDFLYKDMFSNGLKFISFERLKKFKTEKELIQFASSFDINKIIYKNSIDLDSYLDLLIF